MNFNSLLNPLQARCLPKGSTERAISLIALGSLWRGVYEPSPLLREQVANRQNEIFEEFLEWAEKNNLTLNWTLHAHLAHRLEYERGDLKNKKLGSLRMELLAVSASQWVMEDRSSAGAISLTSAQDFPFGIYAAKSPAPDTQRKLRRIRFESKPFHEDALPFVIKFSNSSDMTHGKWSEWNPIPR